ncbi:MAG: hypothetical protein Q8L14_34275 [Myxococcales bacterium]|nr:hypothetical protein [Myxococcales bacterium]
MKRALIVVFVVLALLLVAHGLLVGPMLYAGSKALRERQAESAADQSALATQVMADHLRWQNDPLFQPRDGGDAAEVLFRHVGFEGRGRAPEALPVELMAAVKDAGLGWPTAPIDVATADLAWMSELSRFATWDIEGPGTPLFTAPFDGMNEPLPSYVDIGPIAKVRLLQGLASGKMRPALADVRELARLSLTTEMLIGDMVGVALLRLERRGAEEAVKRGLDLEGWRAFTDDETESLKRALWVATHSTSLIAPLKPLDSQFPLVGRCSAQRELALALYVRPWASSVLSDKYRAFDEQLATSSCRLRRLRKAWATTGEGELPLSGDTFCGATATSSCDVPDIVTHLPLVRPAVGSVLAATASMDPFKLYKDADP